MRYRALIISGGLWLMADLLTKAWAVSTYFKPWVIWPGFFYFSAHSNTGIAFGIPLPLWLQIVTSIILIASLAYYALFSVFSFQFPGHWILGIILGGAIGNLINRLTLGAVIDFIVLKPFPVFNLADVGITVGLAIVILIPKTLTPKNK